MELESAMAGAGVVGVSGLIFKLAWAGLSKRKNGNGISGLTAHNDSSSAHPDIREDMSMMGKKITKIDDRTIGMDKKVDKILEKLDNSG